MRHPLSRSTAPRLALAGLVALGVAMGIGRFAFTPLLPIMLAEGSLGIPQAGLLASANYLGYLVGALACTFAPWAARRLGGRGTPDAPRRVRQGLVATVVFTLAMALGVPAAWSALRFAAGVASAVVFLYTSAWCLEQLARRGEPTMGGLIFIGPGAGILLSGLAASALVEAGAPAAAGWATFGVLAAVLTAIAWPVFDQRHAMAAAPASEAADAQAASLPAEAGVLELALLTLAYGLAGIGYIVTATFLPVIARQALPGSPWLDLFWPLLGLGVMAGALLGSRLGPAGDHRLRLVAGYAVQASGVAASLLAPNAAGFALGSFLVGLPLTAITFFAMQEARRLRPLHAASCMGLLTASYGLGQVAGPPLAAWLVARSPRAAEGFALALWLACGLLVAGALLYLLLAWRWPAGAAAVSGSRAAAPAGRG